MPSSNEQYRGIADWRTWVLPAVACAALAAVAALNFLLFHTLAELFAIVVALLAFPVAWYTFPFSRNNYLMFLACGYFWIAVLDTAHTFAFKGMGILPATGQANAATQFWLAARYCEAVLLAVAPAYLHRTVDRGIAFGAFGAVAVTCGGVILAGHFPDAFAEGSGLTGFKIASEYVIIVVLCGALAHLLARRRALGPIMCPMVATAIVLTAVAEFCFTTYVQVFDTALVVGHLLKLVSFWLIFVSVVHSSLVQPSLDLRRQYEDRERITSELRASERQVRGILDNMADTFYRTDADGVVVQVSQSVYDMLGYRPDEVLGRRLVEFYSNPADRDGLLAEMAAKGGRVQGYRVKLVHKAGHEVWIASSSRFVLDDAGEVAGVEGTARDITEDLRAEQALRTSEERFRALTENVMDLIGVLRPDGNVRFVSPSVQRVLGYEAAELVGRNVLEFVHPDDQQTMQDETGRLLLDPDYVSSVEVRFRRRDGTWVVYECFGRNLLDNAAVGGIVVNGHDVTKHRLAEAEARRAHAMMVDAIDAISEGFVLYDADDRLVLWNSKYLEIYADSAEAIRPGNSFEDILRHGIERGQYADAGGDPEKWILERLARHRNPQGPIEQHLSDGRWLRIEERPTKDGGIVGIRADITDLKNAEQDIRRRAYYDSLTGLANRSNCMERLRDSIVRAQRARTMFGLLYIDLDGFKKTNDTLGHSIGDQLLCQAAERIKSCLRESDHVARLGGDEFTVIAADLKDEIGLSIVCETINRRLAEVFVIDGHEVYTGASIGVTVYPGDGDDVEALLRNADMAMYDAKDSGRNTFKFFTRELTERAETFVRIENELRRAVREGEFVLHYQAVYDLQRNGVAGVEALLRWQHPTRGLIGPDTFIEVAERSGLIVPIGEWVLETAVRAMAASGTPGFVAVNLSTRQFRAGFNARQVSETLSRAGFDPGRLVLEITESLLLEDNVEVQGVFKDLRAIGVAIAVDDFGTGYSALSYLRQFPVSKLKVDKSFVRELETNESDVRLVETIIGMADGLGLDLIAEGVETPRQRDILRDLGCRFIQGYFIGRPEADIAAVLGRANAACN
ncbi:MAG: EAL domain-containing protein [Hyphomicrobiales bacterium]|nr:EAL domain-containing protein [Hyphomicrobiales bacterium]